MACLLDSNAISEPLANMIVNCELFKIPMKADTKSKFSCKCISFSQTMHIANVFWSHKIFFFYKIWCFTVCLISMGWNRKGVTPVRLQWSYVVLALNHRCSSILFNQCDSTDLHHRIFVNKRQCSPWLDNLHGPENIRSKCTPEISVYPSNIPLNITTSRLDTLRLHICTCINPWPMTLGPFMTLITEAGILGKDK